MDEIVTFLLFAFFVFNSFDDEPEFLQAHLLWTILIFNCYESFIVFHESLFIFG